MKSCKKALSAIRRSRIAKEFCQREDYGFCGLKSDCRLLIWQNSTLAVTKEGLSVTTAARNAFDTVGVLVREDCLNKKRCKSFYAINTSFRVMSADLLVMSHNLS
jgi:hypothetical protein